MHLRSIIQKATRACTVGLFGFVATVGILCTNQTVYAHENSSVLFEKGSDKLAERLVTRFWNDVKHANVKAYSKLLAPHFQGINIFGVFTRSQQISGLQGVTVTKFTIKKLISSRYDDTLVISYDFLAEGNGIVSGPSIDVWRKIDHKWKQISHTYVPFNNPI